MISRLRAPCMSHCNLRTRRYRSNEEAVRPLDRHRHNRVLVPYSPLGRGFLTGAVTSTAGLGDTDYRHRDPRFADENAARNTSLVDRVVAVAARHNATPAQVALVGASTRRRRRADSGHEARAVSRAERGRTQTRLDGGRFGATQHDRSGYCRPALLRSDDGACRAVSAVAATVREINTQAREKPDCKAEPRKRDAGDGLVTIL